MLFFNTQSATLPRVEQMTTIQLENLEQTLPVGSDESIAVQEELMRREAQPILIDGQYETYAQYADRMAQATHSPAVIESQEEINATDAWRDQVLAKYGNDEAQSIPAGVEVVPSFEEGQSNLVRSDFAKLYPLTAKDALIQWGNGGMGYGWYLTTQPIDARRNPVTLFWDNGKFIPSSRFEQIAYIPAGVNYFPTPAQISELGDQWEYWSNRRCLAELSGDGDDEEFCSLFVLTVEALLFV